METAEKFVGDITGGRKRNHIDRHKKETEKCNHESMMEQTGLASKEKTIIFSLPVTSTVGLRMYIDEMDMDEEEKDR